MPPCHDVHVHVLSIKAEVGSEEASATGVLSIGVLLVYYRVYRNNIPNELVQPLLTDFRVYTSDPCRVCIGRCLLRYLKVVTSLLIPKSVVLRLVLFRCPYPNTENIKTITEATRENIRIPTSTPYCRVMIYLSSSAHHTNHQRALAALVRWGWGRKIPGNRRTGTQIPREGSYQTTYR